MTAVLTLAYGPDPDQVGDLYLPPVESPPVVMLVHGGFWRSYWQRDVMTPLAERLHDEGFAVWNPEYRRVGAGGGVPTTLRDVAHALDTVDLLAARHGLDASDVTVIGHSAGGHLAAWLAPVVRADAAAHWQIPPAMMAPMRIVALAPVLDLVEAERRVLGAHAAAEFVGVRLETGIDRLLELSPRHHVPLEVPTLVVHGTADDRVHHDMSVEFCDAARAAGDDVELLTLPDVDHFQVIDPSLDSWQHILAWIRATR